MAIITAFDGCNNVLDPVEGMPSKVGSMSVCHALDKDGEFLTISCWKLTAEELEEINKTKRVWVVVLGKTTFPLVVLGCKPEIHQ